MNYSFSYKNKVIVLPEKEVREHLADATREQLAVLLAMAACPDVDGVCTATGLTEGAGLDAVSFWSGTGAVETDGVIKPRKRELKKTDPDRPASKDKVPPYRTDEVVGFVEGDGSCYGVLEICQHTLGKLFNTTEATLIVGLAQYLGVDADYMSVICKYAASRGSDSVRFVEKTAISMYDDGYTTAKEVSEHINVLLRARTLEGVVRTLFGLGERAFTSKEKKYLESWSEEQYDEPLIKLAYEITVTNTGKPSLAYANSVLENWHVSGLDTPEKVNAAAEEYKKKKENAAGGSFNTDDFFEAALRRSYGEDVPQN